MLLLLVCEMERTTSFFCLACFMSKPTREETLTLHLSLRRDFSRILIPFKLPECLWLWQKKKKISKFLQDYTVFHSWLCCTVSRAETECGYIWRLYKNPDMLGAWFLCLVELETFHCLWKLDWNGELHPMYIHTTSFCFPARFSPG